MNREFITHIQLVALQGFGNLVVGTVDSLQQEDNREKRSQLFKNILRIAIFSPTVNKDPHGQSPRGPDTATKEPPKLQRSES